MTCYDWNIGLNEVIPQYDGLEHLVSRLLTDGTKFVIVDNCSNLGQQVVLFQDAPHLNDFPKRFVKVPCFCNSKDLIEYALSENIFSFSLENNTDFEKIKIIIQGEKVYKEKKQDRFWYLDNLHRTHYEVFDLRGTHLGEANLEGEFDPSKRDKTKTIKI